MSEREERARILPMCPKRKRMNGLWMCGAICVCEPYDMACECYWCERADCKKKHPSDFNKIDTRK